VPSESLKNHPKRWKWRLEWLAQMGIESCVGLLPGALVFRLGEVVGGLAWHLMRERRRVVLRNLRIAFYREHDLPALEKMAREVFRRTGGNLLSSAHTARLNADQVAEVLSVENPQLLEDAAAGGRGVVLMPPHMGNWEILSRLNRLFPQGHPIGAFYRPLNNPLIDAQVIAQRGTDGTRLFSKRDSFHQVAGFIREGGIVGILADQRSGRKGEVVRFFGRLTRASPLPGLIARRSKSAVVGLSLITHAPGKWKVRYHAVEGPLNTTRCMVVLERAMKASPLDVFWFQERWKLYLSPKRGIRDWLGSDLHGEGTPHRALVWLAGVAGDWQIPAEWIHPDVIYELVLAPGQKVPGWFGGAGKHHTAPAAADRAAYQKIIATIDRDHPLPVDYILTPAAPKALSKAASREAIPLISLPPQP
jgi:KDO2-lipid IV(A) lauroyltransferase